jgi:hypothetical protein
LGNIKGILIALPRWEHVFHGNSSGWSRPPRSVEEILGHLKSR